jgi:hypothetical protein
VVHDGVCGDLFQSQATHQMVLCRISVAMISRLMLNLHVAATGEIGMDTDMELERVRFVRRSGTDVASGGE